MKSAYRGALAALVLMVVLLIGFAIPAATWRTGDRGLAPLTFEPQPPGPDLARLWIDTDAACGHSARTDPDDCLAIALLARAAGDRIAGISTVAGNAPLEVIERTTRELAARLSATLRVYSGSDAQQAMTAALERGPLTVVALGPLTNVAAVLDARPDLRPRVAQLVSVTGRRPGHLFHPAEGAGRGMLFGHGPIFRDFNFAMDPRAASRVVALNLPLTLVPYDAARRIEVGERDLDRLAAAGGALGWTAERSRAWLAYWREDIGREGFRPFDLLAAAYVVDPRHFRCAAVHVWVGEDTTMFWRPTAMLVGQGPLRAERPQARGSALYCAEVSAGIKPWLMARLAL